MGFLLGNTFPKRTVGKCYIVYRLSVDGQTNGNHIIEEAAKAAERRKSCENYSVSYSHC